MNTKNVKVMTKPKMESQRGPCGPEHGNPNNPNDAQVDVYLTKGCPNPRFDIQSALKQGNDLVFNNNRRPGFNITFTLHDQTGSGYVFLPVPDDACWSQWGTACPKTAVHEVFCPKSVSGTTLKVYNFNPRNAPEGGSFKYTLRVTKDGGKTPCNLDPGGVDNNGSRQ